ncbi:MAG: succinate dehydrogenase, hydrophobic membrane anchor protein [Alphaproteobacteria bacterium]|nr:succinate dehydrogenase, hydrophobic membrane anchor protein [Alphaproteobacteria bacterium]
MSGTESPKRDMRTPLGRVRGLGAARSGTSDFWRQRVTGIAMTLLMIPLLVIILMLLGRNHASAVLFLSSWWIAVIMLLFIVSCAWHMKIGLQVVIEDYVQDEKLKLLAMIGNNFFAAAVAIASVYAIIKLSSGV